MSRNQPEDAPWTLREDARAGNIGFSQANRDVLAAQILWERKHPGSCPMCGLPFFVHEEYGGCRYYNPELYVGTPYQKESIEEVEAEIAMLEARIAERIPT